MRSVVYKYDDLPHLEDALDNASGQALPLPDGSTVRDGEWVLAMFELGATRRATAAAGRGAIQEAGPALVFERRDWERLRAFATARGRSELRLAAASPSGEIATPSPLASLASLASLEDVEADTARSGVHAAGSNIPIGPEPALFEASSPAQTASRVPSRSPSTRPRPGASPNTSRGTGRTADLDALRSTASWETNTVSQEVAAAPPLHPSADSPLGAPRGESRAGSTVLIVDDDEDLREVVGAMLDAVGLGVETVGSAEEALDHARLRPIDLMVLDWSLPKMSGIELCREIRRDAALVHLPVLFLTAHSATQDMVEAFAAGADDYVVKPFRAAELGARIFGLLRRARLGAKDAR